MSLVTSASSWIPVDVERDAGHESVCHYVLSAGDGLCWGLLPLVEGQQDTTSQTDAAPCAAPEVDHGRWLLRPGRQGPL